MFDGYSLISSQKTFTLVGVSQDLLPAFVIAASNSKYSLLASYLRCLSSLVGDGKCARRYIIRHQILASNDVLSGKVRRNNELPVGDDDTLAYKYQHEILHKNEELILNEYRKS